QLNNIGSINCSGPEGYKTLYLRIKWNRLDDEPPQNVTIYLFSKTSSSYFYYNLAEKFSNSTINTWNNLTIPLGSETWANNNAASWGSINGLKLEFTWPNSSNITLLVDGLFFGGVFGPPVEDIVGYMLSFSVYSFMQFFVKWVFLGGLFYVMVKAFGAKTVWRPLLISAGFALITMFVQALINAVAFSTLPTLYYPFELIGGVAGETETAYNTILQETWFVSQISTYIQIGVYVWTIALGAIAIRSLTEFKWTKSFLIATLAYFISMMVESLMLGY
ncbi:MAG: Yip1 family protein, partial [Candidatus Bathyarchaeia archaeon]